MRFRLDRFSTRTPLPTRGSEVPDFFFLLGIYAGHRLASTPELLHQVSYIAKLGIPIRVTLTLKNLARTLQAVPHRRQHFRYHRMRDLIAAPNQLSRKRACRLRRPPQRPLRITTTLRLHQRIEFLFNPRHRQLCQLPTSTRRTNPIQRFNASIHIPRAVLHHRQGYPRRVRHSFHPTMTQRTRRRPRHYPALTLVQMWQDRLEEKREVVIGHTESPHRMNILGPSKPTWTPRQDRKQTAEANRDPIVGTVRITFIMFLI